MELGGFRPIRPPGADVARLHEAQTGLGRELIRHLDDEEDLVVPLLLERGERALLGGG